MHRLALWPLTFFHAQPVARVAHTLHLDNVHVSEWVHGGHSSSSGGRPVAVGFGSLRRAAVADA